MDPFVTSLLAFLAAYLLGSISTAYIVARSVKGLDIRTVGSRNPGALNVYREIGVWAGASVLAIDALKGVGVMVMVLALGLGNAAMFSGAIGLLLGHNWPVFLRFRGGKGVATIFGLSLGVLPLLTLLAVAVAVVFGLLSRNAIFGISAGFVALNAFTISTGQSVAQISLCLTLSAVVIAAHFAISYKEVAAAVRAKGAWGLFEVG